MSVKFFHAALHRRALRRAVRIGPLALFFDRFRPKWALTVGASHARFILNVHRLTVIYWRRRRR